MGFVWGFHTENGKGNFHRLWLKATVRTKPFNNICTPLCFRLFHKIITTWVWTQGLIAFTQWVDSGAGCWEPEVLDQCDSAWASKTKVPCGGKGWPSGRLPHLQLGLSTSQLGSPTFYFWFQIDIYNLHRLIRVTTLCQNIIFHIKSKKQSWPFLPLCVMSTQDTQFAVAKGLPENFRIPSLCHVDDSAHIGTYITPFPSTTQVCVERKGWPCEKNSCRIVILNLMASDRWEVLDLVSKDLPSVSHKHHYFGSYSNPVNHSLRIMSFGVKYHCLFHSTDELVSFKPLYVS